MAHICLPFRVWTLPQYRAFGVRKMVSKDSAMACMQSFKKLEVPFLVSHMDSSEEGKCYC